MRRMGIQKKPKYLPRKQALASNGQCQLISLWVNLFGHLQQEVCQILLTRNDIADRTQYLNAQNTFTEALHMGMIPIVNENDTIAVSEIRQVDRFGDNDTLSAITAAMVQADYLFLMTDVDCLYDKNPRTNPDAQPIEVVNDVGALEADVSSSGSALGTGGMSTKIVAARLATSAGVTTIISRASNPGNILNIVSYLQCLKRNLHSNPSSQPETPAATALENGSLSNSVSSLQELDFALPSVPPKHTRFLPNPHRIRDRSFWLLHGIAPHGTVYIDKGAHRALSAKAGLLPVGIIDVEGQFAQQEAVRLVVVSRPKGDATALPPDALGRSAAPPLERSNSSQPLKIEDCVGVPVDVEHPPVEVGRALVNYSSAEIARIKGCQSTEILDLLGFADSEYVALRENVSLVTKYGAPGDGSRPVTPGPAGAPLSE